MIRLSNPTRPLQGIPSDEKKKLNIAPEKFPISKPPVRVLRFFSSTRTHAVRLFYNLTLIYNLFDSWVYTIVVAAARSES